MKSNMVIQRKSQEDLFAEWRELGTEIAVLAQAHTENVFIVQANHIIESLEESNQLWYAPADELHATLDKAILLQAIINRDVQPIREAADRALEILMDVPLYEPASVDYIMVLGTCS